MKRNNLYKALLVSALVIFGVFVGGTTSVHAGLQAIPATNSPAGQRDKYQTDLFTGSAGYDYPLQVPPGTHGLTPIVALSYSSLGASDQSTKFGLGWQLNQDRIERDNHFTPGEATVSDDTYKLFFKGASYDLVYVSAENRYHTTVESFLNIQKLPGGINNYGEYWQVITPDGTKYRFGYTADSEVACMGRSTARTWNMDLVTDLHNNHIYYTYYKDNGLAYLVKIEYNNDKQRVINFTHDDSGAHGTFYPQGCKTMENSRLVIVDMTAGGLLVHRYDLGFTQAGNFKKLLTSVTEMGKDGSTLPATNFEYYPQIKNWDTQSVNWLDNADVDVHLQQPEVRVVDVTGDSLPDIVKTVQNGGRDTWKVWRNTGSTWNTQPELWEDNADIDVHLQMNEVRIIDVNGDGLADIVKTIQNGGRDTWRVWLNTGTSWSTQSQNWLDNADVDAHLLQTDTRLVDVTGDGLPDVVKGTHDGSRVTWKVLRNTKTAWNTQYETWINNADIDVYLDQPEVMIVDVNGDGLADILKTIQNGGRDTWRVWLNTGASWDTQYSNWIDNAEIDVHLKQSDATLGDVNGDGLPDIIKGIQVNGSVVNFRVWINKGDSWNTQYDNWIDNANIDAYLDQTEVRIVDVNGDGLADILKTIQNGGRDTWRVWLNKGHAPNLLSAVRTSQGGKISIDYGATAAWDNTGPDTVSDLPFSLWAVTKMTKDNGVSGLANTTDVTTFSYTNGLYNSGAREFRGFNNVTATEPKRITNYTFGQDDAKKGRQLIADVRDSQSNLFSRQENTWSNTATNGVYTVLLNQEKNYTHDGTVANPKVTQTDYQYDAYGNTTRAAEAGDISTSGDERFSYSEFVTNPAIWLVNTPRHTYLRGPDDATIFAENWLYYDGHPNATDAPTLGDVTKTVTWAESGKTPTVTYEYDTYGNKTKEIDANNHATQYTYKINDQTATFPERITNAKNQTSNATYDLGTGNVLSRTDANNIATTFQYDAFGRVTKEIQPYDTDTYPTVSYQYFWDGAAPEAVVTAKRESSGAAGTLDLYTWTDGFGRTVQARSEAEDPAKQIVEDTFYDSTGQVGKKTIPHFDTLTTGYTAPVAGVGATVTAYDALGRVISAIDPNGKMKTVGYNHWLQTITNENGHVSKQTLNAYNKISQVDELNGAVANSTVYTFNPRQDLSKIVDAAGNVSTFGYDGLSRKKSQTDQDSGSQSFEYDGVGNVIKQTDAKNIVITKTYDELNRLVKNDYPTDTDVIYTYDIGKIGVLSDVTDQAGVVHYSYDNRLRKTQEQRILDGITWTTLFGYDALNRVISRTNPDGEVLAYSYNAQGQLDKLAGSVTNFDYNAANKVTKKVFTNNLVSDFTYNPTDLRLSKIHTGNLQDLNYTYDDSGNVKTINDTVRATTQTFGYDYAERLITGQETNGYNHVYEYNPIGNLTKFTDNGNPTTYTYGQSAGPHAVTTSSETGTVGGYNGEYFDNMNLSGTPKLTRQDAAIDFDWARSSPNALIPVDGFSVRWTGSQAFEAADYTFTVTADDGIRVYVDGVLVIDKWINQSATTYTATKIMTPGNHSVKVEFYDSGEEAVAKFNVVKTVVTPTPSPTPTPTGAPVAGFSGQYFDNRTLTGTPKLTRQDATVNFDWGGSSPDATLPADNFSVRWTASPTFEAANYTFTITGDDGIRLYVDNVLVIDKWIDQSPTTYTTNKTMTAGTHPIKIEYYDSGGGAVAKFSMAKVVLQPTPTPGTTTYTGEYFDNKSLAGSAKLVRADSAINFAWGTNAPDPTIPADNFSVRWTKQTLFEAADYTFSVTADDGVRVYVDGVVLIDKWIDQGPTTYISNKVMTAGNHLIKIEYYDSGWDATAKFSVTKTAFTGEYYDNMNLTGTPKLTRQDPVINFDWSSGSPDPLIPVDGFSARWTTTQAFDAAPYLFTVLADDGVRLYIDNVLVIDKWINQSPTTYTATKSMTAGTHSLKIEYFENGGGATAKFFFNKQ